MRHPPTLIPDDVHNRALLQNVHPPGWRNAEPARRYTLVVVGGGTAGLVTAAGAAGLGARVALVERHLLGGDCLNVGCVPSKAVIRSSRVVADLREAAALGVKVPDGVTVDFGAVMERMRRVRAEISPHDSAWRFSRELGVDVFLAEAAFTGPDAVAVDGRVLRFAKAVIATGSRPGFPPIPGLVEAGSLTNETIFDLTERPPRLAVVGGGPIGCELAQAFRRLGSEVTLLSDVPQLLPREDPDAAEIIRQALLQDGVRLALGVTIVDVTRVGAQKVLRYRGSGREDTLATDEILVATGRVPNVEGLGLEAAGVRCAPEGIVVDDHLRTTNPRIYAAGDVCLGWKFTHAADRPRGSSSRMRSSGSPDGAGSAGSSCPGARTRIRRWRTSASTSSRPASAALRSTRSCAAWRTWTAREPTARWTASSRCTCGGARTGSSAPPSSRAGRAR